jgi:dipeptidyl aminopeptidase/acylaminoacyl peptidase
MDALAHRAAGSRGSADLVDDVLAVVASTTQDRGWSPRIEVGWRPVAILVAAALLVSAAVGLAVAPGGGPPIVSPSTRVGGGGDIAFVRAAYAWDGARDSYGAPVPMAVDPRINTITSLGDEGEVVADVPAIADGRVVGASTVGPAVRWSPDGSRIAFRLYSGAPGIYVVNRDGSDLTRLTAMPEPFMSRFNDPEGGFAWSPDGTRIAFTSPRDRRLAPLYLVDTRDGRLTQLTGDDPAEGALPPIAWSPDGSRIAFGRSIGALRGATHSIHVIDANGTHERQIVEVDHADIFGFGWSPDGTRIAFSRTTFVPTGDATLSDLRGGVWLVSADGTGLEWIYGSDRIQHSDVLAVHDAPFAWSPDGRMIATVIPGIGAVVVATDGSGERIQRLDMSWPGGSFDWSPDGSQLVFSDSGSTASVDPPTWDPPSIHVVNADGTGVRWLTDGEFPDWSPIDKGPP